jgi:hypothetical protein
MSVVQYQDTTFLHYKTYWFVWEPAWSLFRPIQSFAWNGTSFVVDDSLYCKDITDPNYGFGSAPMKELCEKLTELFEPQIATSRKIDTPEIGPLIWFRDRRVSITPCCVTDVSSWKRLTNGRSKTCRRGNAFQYTRRSHFQK